MIRSRGEERRGVCWMDMRLPGPRMRWFDSVKVDMKMGVDDTQDIVCEWYRFTVATPVRKRSIVSAWCIFCWVFFSNNTHYEWTASALYCHFSIANFPTERITNSRLHLCFQVLIYADLQHQTLKSWLMNKYLSNVSERYQYKLKYSLAFFNLSLNRKLIIPMYLNFSSC